MNLHFNNGQIRKRAQHLGFQWFRSASMLFAIFILTLLTNSCYSFRGSSVPPHLKTISLAKVVDNSNFGSAVYKDLCTQFLTDRFRAESLLQFVDKDGDARLVAVLTDIRDEAISVKSGEIERERKVRVSIEAEYYDAVKKRQIFKKSFSNTSVFVVANAITERDKAIRTALKQDVDDILLAVVSGW